MSVRVMSWVWEHSRSRGSTKLVLLAIADHAKDDGGSAYPSVTHLAEKCGMNRSTVMEAIARLEDLGELIVERHKGAGSRYRVVMEPVGIYDLSDAMNRSEIPTTNQSERPTGRKSELVGNPDPTGRNGRPDRSDLPTRNHQEPSTTVTDTSGRPIAASKIGTDDDPHFVAFWSAYPRKVSKGQARRAWRAAVKQAEPTEIIEGAIRYRNDPNRSADFTAHPSTWLNGERWNDDPLPPRSEPQARGGGPKW